MRRYTWALAIVCFLVILLAAPLLFSDRYSRLTLQSGAVFAASNNSYSLSAPVRLMTGPTIELEGGTLSVPPSRTGLARGGQMIAMLITGSGPQMTLEKAIFTADFSTREPTFSQDSGRGDIAPLVKALQRMQFDGLIVRDSTVRIKMSDGSTVDIEDVNATITSKPNGDAHAVGSFGFRGERMNFDTTLGASLDAQGMSRPITASFTGAPLTATLDFADRGEGRLRDPLLREPAAHRDLVRHPVRDLRPDRRQPEALGDGRDDRDGPIGRHRQRTVNSVTARDLFDGRDVREVDHLRDVRHPEPRGVGVPVDGHDPETALLRLQDRASLMSAGADEQDRGHGAMLRPRGAVVLPLDDVGRVAQEVPGPGPATRSAVVPVEQGARAEREAAAADAGREVVAQPLELRDPRVDVAAPRPRQALPVAPGRGPIARQPVERVTKPPEGDSRRPPGVDHGDPPQHRAREPTLIPVRSAGPDQALGLVEPKRGRGHPAAPRKLADRQLGRFHPTSSLALDLKRT